MKREHRRQRFGGNLLSYTCLQQAAEARTAVRSQQHQVGRRAFGETANANGPVWSFDYGRGGAGQLVTFNEGSNALLNVAPVAGGRHNVQQVQRGVGKQREDAAQARRGVFGLGRKSQTER